MKKKRRVNVVGSLCLQCFPCKSSAIEFCKGKPEDVKLCTLRSATGMP